MKNKWKKYDRKYLNVRMLSLGQKEDLERHKNVIIKKYHKLEEGWI